MAAANASARGQRHAILGSPLRELTGFALASAVRTRLWRAPDGGLAG